MPSTYSTSLGIELIGNGEQAGTWGTTTNNNLGTLIEQAIAGVEGITLTGDYTLTDFNGLTDEARNAVLVFNGSLGAPCNVVAPSVSKTYIVRNVSGATVTVKTSAGNGVALTNAASAVIFCDGTNFFSATTLNLIDGNLTVTGTTTLQGAVTANSTVTIKGDVFANSNTGQIYIPVGTTGQRAGSPISGVFRYNTTLNQYEGYSNNSWIVFQTVPQGNYTGAYVVVAGGGGGSRGTPNAYPGAGGGAGGYLASSFTLVPGTTYSCVIGSGGAGGTAGSSQGTQGSPTSITGLISTVGGGGADSQPGGSGAGGLSVGGAGTSGQGNNGGSGAQYSGGGGGGATGVGGNGGASTGGNGGAGALTTITGSNVYLAGGGGGAAGYDGTPGAGGLGGGGAGSVNGTGASGAVNTGGGAGGGGNDAGAGGGGNGGSGVIYISVPTVNYTGTTTGSPTVTTSGSNTVIKFIASGSYTA
jgi:hypothetical protein